MRKLLDRAFTVRRLRDLESEVDVLARDLIEATPDSRQRDIAQMVMVFQSLIGERRANPGPRLVSAVVNAGVDGAHLADQDIVGFNMLLLIFGNERVGSFLLRGFHHLWPEWPELRG